MKVECPATPLWWEREQFSQHYVRPRRFGDPIYTAPAPRLKYHDELRREASMDGRHYRRVDMSVTWEIGSMVFSQHEIDRGREHWHTSFILADHHIHVDFVAFCLGSPQTNAREYRVHADGQELGRGGGYLGFMMAVFGSLHNWPLSVEVGPFLLYSYSMIKEWSSTQSDTTNAITIWQLVEGK